MTSWNEAPNRSVEQRLDRRPLPVAVLGRYMLPDRQEHACQTAEISPGEIALIAPRKGALGERIVCYLDHFGRFEGPIRRHFTGGFSFETTTPQAKRETLAERLTWFADHAGPDGSLQRGQDWITPRQPRSTLLLADGSQHAVVLTDLSLAGAVLAASVRPAVGTLVRIGQRQARVAKVSHESITVEFLRLIPREAFDEQMEL